MAKRQAQADYTFYHNERQAYANLTSDGVAYKTALLDAKGGTPMSGVESILHIYEFTDSGPGCELELAMAGQDRRWVYNDVAGYVYLRTGKLYYRQQEYAAPTNTEVLLDVNQFRPDYSDDTDTDFFLDVGAEWLLYKTLTFLQMRVKEDYRLNITRSMLSGAWNALIRWDRGIDFDKQDGIDLD